MVKVKLEYLSIFLALISLLSFLNILYSYYFNLYLNLNTYFYTLLISGFFSLIFFKFQSNKEKPSLFEKILTILFGYIFIPLILLIPRSDFIFKKKDTVVFLAKKDAISIVENLFRISAI